MVVRDRDAPRPQQPIGGASVPTPARMTAEDRSLDIGSSNAEKLRLDERMVSPDDDPRRVRGHRVIFGALPDVEPQVVGGHLEADPLRADLERGARECRIRVEGDVSTGAD